MADDTAAPSLTSGFGTVMEHERHLQASTEACLRLEDGAHSTSLQQVLRGQSARLGSNIALLEQRYEGLPHPERFHAFRGRLAHLAPDAPAAAGARTDPLPPLIALHRSLLADIVTLMIHRPNGQRSELILAEVARSHGQMALRLTSLIMPDAAAHDSMPAPVVASAVEMAPNPGEGNWENEGGAARPAAVISVDRVRRKTLP